MIFFCRHSRRATMPCGPTEQRLDSPSRKTEEIRGKINADAARLKWDPFEKICRMRAQSFFVFSWYIRCRLEDVDNVALRLSGVNNGARESTASVTGMRDLVRLPVNRSFATGQRRSRRGPAYVVADTPGPVGSAGGWASLGIEVGLGTGPSPWLRSG